MQNNNNANKILFLCEWEELTRERKGYFSAFTSHGFTVICTGDIDCLQKEELESVVLIIQPEASAILPYGMKEYNIPVVCFHIDTNVAARQRANASLFFDIVFLFHPGYEKLFVDRGNENVFLLPHAIEKELFLPTFKADRRFEVASVGRTDNMNYSIRKGIFNVLREKYVCNDFFCFYSQKELISIYEDAQIVLNVGKNDYLKDANIRCFEAMASGALLMTFSPTELLDLGFEDGTHFIGFSSIEELIVKIDYFLKNPHEREKIAQQGQALTLNKHTYDYRVNQMFDIVHNIKAKEENLVSNQQKDLFCMLKYFVFRRRWDKALEVFNKIKFSSIYKFIGMKSLGKLFLSKKIHGESLIK